MFRLKIQGGFLLICVVVILTTGAVLANSSPVQVVKEFLNLVREQDRVSAFEFLTPDAVQAENFSTRMLGKPDSDHFRTHYRKFKTPVLIKRAGKTAYAEVTFEQTNPMYGTGYADGDVQFYLQVYQFELYQIKGEWKINSWEHTETVRVR